MDFSSHLRSLELDDERLAALVRSRRIQAFSPHPDDVELIAGGFLADRVSAGCEVEFVLVSDGRKGSRTLTEEETAAVRMREQLEALKVLGVERFVFLGYRDTEVPPPSVLRDTILEKMRAFRPDLVVTVDPFLKTEVHPDHINTALAVLQAVLFFGLPNIGRGRPESPPPLVALGGTNEPNVIFNCERYIEQKKRAVMCHASQFDSSALEQLALLSQLVGARIGAKWAEPFRVLYPSELHIPILGGMRPS